MIDADHLARARDADLMATAEALGARLRRAGKNELIGPCPVCGGTDRFAINLKLRVWNCRVCARSGNVIALVMHVHGLDFRQAVAFLVGGDVTPAPPRPKPPATDSGGHDAFVERLVADIVRELVPPRRTPGERYLAEARAIDVEAIADVLNRKDAIGWHPSILFREEGHALDGKRLGCIVGVMTDPITAQPTGAISRTYLAPDGTKVGKARTLGRPMGIVRLSRDEDVLEGLCLAEGKETALAAMSKGLRPMWSTGSTALMATFPVLDGVQAINVVVDHDRNGAGERAARELEARWLAAGREAALFRPDAPGDFNDAVKGFP